MTDISVTATAVIAGSGAVKGSGTSGETITAGKPVYLSSTTRKLMLTDSNSVIAEARRAVGIALNGASLDQPVDYIKSGPLTMNAVLTANVPFFCSDTPGGICPIADVGSGEYLCQLGIASSTTVLQVNIQFTGVSN